MEKPTASWPERGRWHWAPPAFLSPGCTKICGHGHGTERLLSPSPTCLLSSPLATVTGGNHLSRHQWIGRSCASQDRPGLESLFHHKLIVWPSVDYLNSETQCLHVGGGGHHSCLTGCLRRWIKYLHKQTPHSTQPGSFPLSVPPSRPLSKWISNSGDGVLSPPVLPTLTLSQAVFAWLRVWGYFVEVHAEKRAQKPE